MKIGISGFVFQKGKSGVGIYLSSLIKALLKVDHENEYFIHLSRNESREIDCFKPIISSNLFENPIANIIWQNTVAPFKARNYDVFHVPTIRRVPLIKGCPVVTTVHDLAPFKLKGKYDPLRTFYHHEVLSRLIHRSDHIITVSQSTKKDIIEILKYPEDKITVIYPGVDHEVFKRKPVKSHPFIVYVSRIEHPGKNHIKLIEAFEQFKKRTALPHHLILAGADWQGADVVKKRAAESPYSDAIIFKGFVTIDEMVSLYSSCDLMVYPSLYEGFGLPIIEAMACGAKVICSNNSSLKEIGEGKALLFDPFNVSEISETIEEGLKNNRDLSSYASQFSWEKTAKEVLKVYQEVAK